MDCDLIIIGAGPAGLTAAQYGARANLKVTVIEQLGFGGQALVIDRLENYPGNVELFDEAGKICAPLKSGYDFAMDLYRQAESFGASFVMASVVSLKKENDIFRITLSDERIFSAGAVIIATGSKPRPLGIPGEREFTGRGVSFCAVCDGSFFRDKKIFVVGGGDAACDEARYLSRLSDKIVLIHRRDAFRAQKALVERTLNNPNIEVRLNTLIKEIRGGPKANPGGLSFQVQEVKQVLLFNTLNGKVYEEDTDAVFIFVGTVPQLDFPTKELNLALDENGYIITDQKMATNITGLYAAGDIRSGAFRQVITACADGAAAAHKAAEYLESVY